MRIYYDTQKRNIIFEGFNRYFSMGSLVALADGDDVDIKYSDTNISEFYLYYEDVQDEQGNSAGANAIEVSAYLNQEFNKGSVSEQLIVMPFGGQFLLDPNEYNGWGSIGAGDDTNTQDLGDVGANLSRYAGGFVFPFDVELVSFQAWHRNSNAAALPWGWVISKQLKVDNSNSVTTEFILDESTVRASVLNGLGLRNYLSNSNQYTEFDFSNDSIVIEKGQVLNLSIGAPTAITTNYYVQVMGGSFTFKKI